MTESLDRPGRGLCTECDNGLPRVGARVNRHTEGGTMKDRDVMSAPPHTGRSVTDLATASRRMKPTATGITDPRIIPAQTSDVHEDRVLLEGPHSRRKELRLVLRAVRDFIAGFRALHFVGPCVTVFGSARVTESHPYYSIGRHLGAALARLGFTVMTGGGPGLMEAANRGARDAGGRSVGCTIELPREQVQNPYLDRVVHCHHFFVRKVLLFKYSYGFIALPGGLGTLDELSEALTLVQTGKIENFPIVLFGTDYWRSFGEMLDRMAAEGTIGLRELDLMLVTDDIEEAVAHIRRFAIEQFGLRRVPFKPSSWLGEPRPLGF